MQPAIDPYAKGKPCRMCRHYGGTMNGTAVVWCLRSKHANGVPQYGCAFWSSTSEDNSAVARDALHAFARMINTGDVEHIERYLVDDFVYASKDLVVQIPSKAEYLQYMSHRIESLRHKRVRLFAELADIEDMPCVLLALHEKERVTSMVTAVAEAGYLTRLEVIAVPRPFNPKRSGCYPT